MFDRVLAGWQVHVAVADTEDAAALRILGVTVVDVADCLHTPGVDHAHSVAVAADLYDGDAGVRETVARLVARGHAEVAIWGDGSVGREFAREWQPARHRLSAAARAFKARALDSARVTHGGVEDSEHFTCTGLRHVPDDRDLICGATTTLRRARG